MFRRMHTHSLRGFTLVELAIVLSIVGVLAAGLWRLMSTSNQQTKDSATAQQQLTLIAAVKGYMADTSATGGQTMITAKNPSTYTTIPLPALNTSVGVCQGSIFGGAAGNFASLCNYLPTGFTSATTNPYGQTYAIQVLKDASAAGTAPQVYSFMIITNNTTTQIADPNGGRISDLIGGDGGFIFSANVCGAGYACGTMGAWSVANVATQYGFAGGYGAGSVASLSFVSSSSSGNYNWLARVVMPSDVGSATPFYNTMQTNLLLGTGNTLFLGSSTSPAVTTGGGTINFQTGTLTGNVNATNFNLGLAPTGGTGSIWLVGASILNNSSTLNPALQVTDSAGCSPNCATAILAVSGSATISGSLTANSFIYQGSDMRLKKNIVALSDPLADIMKIRPVSFDYRSSGKPSMGVIAQDLEKIYPQLVAENPQGLKMVSYEGLIAPLIGSVQELKKENEGLRDILRAQIARQDEMEKEIKDLRRK